MRKILKILAALFGGPLLIVIPAHAQLFVADYGGLSGDGLISEYTLSGASLNPTLITGLFETPALAVDGYGNLFVADQAHQTIAEYTTAGKTVNVNLIRGLNNPSGMALDGAGNLYVADTGNSRVGQYATNGTTVNANFITGFSPSAVALDGNGDLFVADISNHKIVEYTIGGRPVNTNLIAGVAALDLKCDGTGHLFVLYELIIPQTYAGDAIGEYTVSGVPLYTNRTSFTSLETMALDGDGHIFVADESTKSVTEYTTSGTRVNSITNSAGAYAIAIAPPAGSTFALTTIDPANHYAYGANLGWVDWRGDGSRGAVVGEYVCFGKIYSANVGWINLGNGAPANGIYYQNLSAADFGVNQDGLGNLRGYAWGANIGWVNFENSGAPQVNLRTGIFSGYAYSANCGWISLSNAFAYVQTDLIAPGLDSTGDGIPDAWALQNFGTVNIDPNADPDKDGMSNFEEYMAGTDPNNSNDVFRIASFQYSATAGNTTLQWTAKPTRFYAIQSTTNVASIASWHDVDSLPLGTAAASFVDTNLNESYRVRAFRQLTP